MSVDPASFRDPSGFVFWNDNHVYRQVNASYKGDFQALTTSGLLERLFEKEYLIPHEEIEPSSHQNNSAYKILKPDPIPFISYPYEWSFSQLKDAALLTLDIQLCALESEMTLKDANAYNIQFYKGKPLLIDTLSFAQKKRGEPWIGYKQFCQHFLAPLALMAHRDIRLNRLLSLYIDGIPLDLAADLLPLKTKLNFGLLSNIHMHAVSQKRHGSNQKNKAKQVSLSDKNIRALILTLRNTVEKLQYQPQGTEWVDYYESTNYSDSALRQKEGIISEYLRQLRPAVVWDLGGNIGHFSRIAAENSDYVVSFDIDPAAVENNYQVVRKNNEKTLLPLVLDLTNPSPDLGWANSERGSLQERGPVDTAMALALIHHLAISNNIPLSLIARYFSTLCNSLVIEFVPKSDSQVKRLLSTRKDIFPDYTKQSFEQEFSHYFKILRTSNIEGSERIFYLMESR